MGIVTNPKYELRDVGVGPDYPNIKPIRNLMYSFEWQVNMEVYHKKKKKVINHIEIAHGKTHIRAIEHAVNELPRYLEFRNVNSAKPTPCYFCYDADLGFLDGFVPPEEWPVAEEYINSSNEIWEIQ